MYCMCVCVCAYEFVSACWFAWMNPYIPACTYAHKPVHIHGYTHMYLITYVCTYMRKYFFYTCIHAHVPYIHTYINSHTHTYKCMHTYKDD